jgi:pyridoxine 5-phosphate synthase
MTRLSVNINKIATLRNARGGNVPNVVEAAKNIEKFGAQGITVHPRPDERHIRYQDVRELISVVKTEFNIEGNPNPKFVELVLQNKPAQVTLVPDAEDVLTSNAGWDTIKHKSFLQEIIKAFKDEGIRTSIFVNPDVKWIEGAKETGADRIELYTESYAVNYSINPSKAIAPYIECAKKAHEMGLGINAGHDLSLENIEFFNKELPYLDEVSIGHALIAESLYEGLETVIKKYLSLLK